MMLANATITIYNRKAGSKTTFDTWNRTVIRGVHVYVDHKVSAGDSGLNSAEVYKIRIPTDVENADQYFRQKSMQNWIIRLDIGQSRMMITLFWVNVVKTLRSQQICRR